jgi:hypothetical protein
MTPSGFRKETSATIDHWIPKAMMIKPMEDNLVLACRRCNEKKGSSLPPGWEKYAEYIMGGVPGDIIRDGPWELIPYQGWKWVGYDIPENPQS